ncbi:NAD(P)-binding domain-containing protein [Alphaproteobacteria bacterium]|nr:NAD(P)-binding domain-containing protein [Alphaproteobacteria bacterium]
MSEKICIIGAGCSGFTMAKRLKDFGLDYDQFEASDDIGGNWYHNNPNGMSACYESLHIDTSKYRLAFEDFPVPHDWPDFPHHSQLLQYFKDYVAHFGLRKNITFNTRVEDAAREADGRWRVRLSNGKTNYYKALIVANGHHWDPKIPTEYKGAFKGVQFHSHAYDSPFAPYDLRGKRVLVVGVGNSAMDIASEVSQRPIAEKLFISTRRGVWILPKYLNGQATDKAVFPTWMPSKIGLKLAQWAIKKNIGKMEDYGLPKPDHEPLTAHPSISGEFLTRVGCGDIHVKPGIDKLLPTGVAFADGTKEKIDVIIWATGYAISFPFLKQNELAVVNNQFPLYRRMIKPGWDNLFFMGLAQPLPTLVNFAEQQSKYVASVLSGRINLPSAEKMSARIEADEKRYLGHYYKSERHTIQVDFNKYVGDIKKDMGHKWIPAP